MSKLVIKTKVTEDGRIVISAKIREEPGIEFGENVTMRIENNAVQLTTQKETLRRLRFMVRKHVPECVSF